MKKIIGLFVLTMAGILLFAQNFYAQEKAGSVEDLDVQFEKPSYFLLEPIFATFKYKLSSTENMPELSRETLVRVYFNGKTTEFSGLTFNITKGEPQPLPAGNFVLKNSASAPQNRDYEKEQIIERSAEFFPHAGDYKIQFVLRGIASKLIDIKIENPIGLNKDAFNFLNQHEGNVSFDWVWKEKNGIALLETFVDKYGDSVYGETAIQILGIYYFFCDEHDKAQAAFEKIKNSPHKPVFENAKQFLSDIAKRKAELQKQK